MTTAAVSGKRAAPQGRRPASRRPPAESDPEDEDSDEPRPVDAFDRLRRGVAVVPQGGASDVEDEQAWMTTYTDMVTLLLTCFIILISLATFTGRQAAPPAAGDRLVTALESEPEPEPERLLRVPDALFLRQPPDSWSARLSRDLERFVERVPVPDGMAVERGETMVTIRLNDRLLFPSGRVEIDGAGQVLLHQLAPFLQDTPARIEVQGHTDSVPINSWLFPSNWELSGARAAAVVRALIDGGVHADRVFAAGYADTVPRAGNDTAAGRQENRRVELVLRAPFGPPSAAVLPAPAAQR